MRRNTQTFTDSTHDPKRKWQHINECNKNIHEPQNLCIITTQIDTVDKLNMPITTEDNIWHNIGLTLKTAQWSHQAVVTVSRSIWKTTKIKWSRHRSFLYGCDRSPEIHVLKLGTKISNLKQHNWSTKKRFGNSKFGSTITCKEELAPSWRPFENGTN